MSDKLVLISQKAKSYVALYDKLIHPARPRWTDEFLSAIWLDKLARSRRLTRIRKVSGQVDEYRTRAVDTLRELLDVAGELKRSAEATNAMSIGLLARLESDIKIEQVQVTALRKSCKSTIKLVAARTGQPMPEELDEWTLISVPFDEVESTTERISHQRHWAALVQAITKLSGLHAEQAKAELSLQRSSVIEQRVSGYLMRLETENRLVGRRFDELEAEIRIGELESILGTLDGKQSGDPALIDLQQIDKLEFDENAPAAT